MTNDEACDEIFGLFRDYWNAQTPALNSGQPVEIHWPGVTVEAPEKAYARVRLQHIPSRQLTFGETGQRRFGRAGFVSVEVFAPLNNGQGFSLSQNLAIIARDAYEGRGTATGIWFRNARINDVGPSEQFYQMNVLIEFEYDELK